MAEKCCSTASWSEILLDVIIFRNVKKSAQQATGVLVEASLEVPCIKVILDFLMKYTIIASSTRVLDIASANSSAGNPCSLLFQTRQPLLKFGSRTPNSGRKIISKKFALSSGTKKTEKLQ